VKSRVAPALEGVAGTLTHLQFEISVADERRSDEVDVGYEVGVVVGKLRRLKDLMLALSQDGRVYHAFAQGLAASGGDRPLPLLWRLMLPSGLTANADLVASLLLPSVRVLVVSNLSPRSALLTACALRQAGYKHTAVLAFDPFSAPWHLFDELAGALPSIARCCCRVPEMKALGAWSDPACDSWTILWKDCLP
jgi:hypothetical protein